LKIPNISRTAPGRELIKDLQIVRIIEIDGIDEQADGGTHVANTSELGQINLQKIENKGKKNKRLYFTLSP
jgi:misacylated tRNA(Ala) deacylase